jgi:hypothetical protein
VSARRKAKAPPAPTAADVLAAAGRTARIVASSCFAFACVMRPSWIQFG